MARNEELERRCLNWARWKDGVGQGGLGWAVVYLSSAGSGRDGYREAKVPTLDVEAEQTDRAIQSLESHLRRTVEVYYLGTGSMEERCRHLQVSRPTIYTRIDQAHEALAAWLRDVEARARHERERVELATRRATKGSFKD